jgi:hypothetical protein
MKCYHFFMLLPIEVLLHCCRWGLGTKLRPTVGHRRSHEFLGSGRQWWGENLWREFRSRSVEIVAVHTLQWSNVILVSTPINLMIDLIHKLISYISVYAMGTRKRECHVSVLLMAIDRMVDRVGSEVEALACPIHLKPTDASTPPKNKTVAQCI